MFLGLFAINFTLIHFTYIFNVKVGHLQLLVYSCYVHSCSCGTSWWWLIFGVKTSYRKSYCKRVFCVR